MATAGRSCGEESVRHLQNRADTCRQLHSYKPMPRLTSATTANGKPSRLLGNYRSFSRQDLPASRGCRGVSNDLVLRTVLIGMEGANEAFPQSVTEAIWKMAHRKAADFRHLEAMGHGTKTRDCIASKLFRRLHATCSLNFVLLCLQFFFTIEDARADARTWSRGHFPAAIRTSPE